MLFHSFINSQPQLFIKEKRKKRKKKEERRKGWLVLLVNTLRLPRTFVKKQKARFTVSLSLSLSLSLTLKLQIFNTIWIPFEHIFWCADLIPFSLLWLNSIFFCYFPNQTHWSFYFISINSELSPNRGFYFYCNRLTSRIREATVKKVNFGFSMRWLSLSLSQFFFFNY